MADGPVTLTLKGGTGYDEPWLVVSGNDWDEIVARLSSVPGVTDDHVNALAARFVDATGVAAIKGAGGTVGEAAPVEAAPEPAQPSAPKAKGEIQIKEPNAPATPGQLGFLKKLKVTDAMAKRLVGVGLGELTKGKASELIDLVNEG